MMVSIEVPVIRGGWLVHCVDSVLRQNSPNWTLSLRWDGGDELSYQILERLAAAGHPRIQVFFGERTGIARARHFLTEHSRGELVLPLDDDDVLEPPAVAAFIAAALKRPWGSIFRARRGFIDEEGAPVTMRDWFPFELRHYLLGATLDLSNHAQPYAFPRTSYQRTEGWVGFSDVEFAGEDCSLFAALEEVGEVELIDEVLYQYRLHDLRTSHRIELETANELWRRIADRAVARRCSPVRRINDVPAFAYVPVEPERATIEQVEAVIPFWETNESEIAYHGRRPQRDVVSSWAALGADRHFSQRLRLSGEGLVRMALAFSSTGPVHGVLQVALFEEANGTTPMLELHHVIDSRTAFEFEFISIGIPEGALSVRECRRMEVRFVPAFDNTGRLVLHTIRTADNEMVALMRWFARDPGHCRRGLERCLASLAAAGMPRAAMHIVEQRKSSSANRNEGFRLCSAPWICFIDDDAELTAPGTLQTMLDAMPSLGASLAGPRLITGNRFLYSGLPYTNPLTLQTCVSGMGEADTGQWRETQIVPWLPSTVLLTHRSVMLACGGFDEAYQGSQHEDADFSLRARSRGFRCCYVGQAEAIHHNQLRNGHMSANSSYFRRRWEGRPELFGLDEAAVGA